MRPSHRPLREIVRTPDYEIHVIGGKPIGLRDLYHGLLRVPWWGALSTIVGGYLVLNALFALAFLATGGIANAEPGSFVDAFFFSVQTMGTIGYGAMYPATRLANGLVVAESVTGLIVTALATGLVFVRFSQTRARMVFSAQVAIAPMEGVPTLMVRLGNERRTPIVDAMFRMTITRKLQTKEGVTMYRAEDLRLVRDRAPALSRSWMIMHTITPESPLYGASPESLAATDAEIGVAVAGIDDTSLQPVHARHTWLDKSIVWGARLADVISEPEGKFVLDLTRFHLLEPTAKAEGFPYGADT